MITVSLETAKKLQEAGWRKESHFTYNNTKDLFYFANPIEAKYQTRTFVYCPTAQEILDELPIYIDTKSNEYGSIVLSME
jgi:hypothetical protein